MAQTDCISPRNILRWSTNFQIFNRQRSQEIRFLLDLSAHRETTVCATAAPRMLRRQKDKLAWWEFHELSWRKLTRLKEMQLPRKSEHTTSQAIFSSSSSTPAHKFCNHMHVKYYKKFSFCQECLI